MVEDTVFNEKVRNPKVNVENKLKIFTTGNGFSFVGVAEIK